MGTSIDAYMWYGTPAFTLPDDGEGEDLDLDEFSGDKIEAICKKYNLTYGWVGWSETGYWIGGKGSTAHAYYGAERVDPEVFKVDTALWRGAIALAIEELKPVVWESYPEVRITTDDIGWHIGVNAG